MLRDSTATLGGVKSGPRRVTGGKGGPEFVFVFCVRSGGTEDPLLPDSLLDGSSEWKNELDGSARDTYRDLGLAL